MDDEKYFKLTGNNVIGNHYFYSTDPATAPPKVKFQCKTKFEAKVMIWMVMSFKGTSDIYVHKSIQAVNQETPRRFNTTSGSDRFRHRIPWVPLLFGRFR